MNVSVTEFLCVGPLHDPVTVGICPLPVCPSFNKEPQKKEKVTDSLFAIL